MAKERLEKIQVTGRPTLFTEELGDEICHAVSTSSHGLNTICRENPHFPHPSTIYTWRIKHQIFREKYDAAKRSQADVLVEYITDIIEDDEGDIVFDNEGKLVQAQVRVARAKLKVDTYKWTMARLAPKKYGDKVGEDEDKKQNSFEDMLKILAELSNKK